MNFNNDISDPFPLLDVIHEKYRQHKTKLRFKTRGEILSAAMYIARLSGWQSLSMRKLAELIGCSVPFLYGYFENKDAILIELTRLGFSQLEQIIKDAEKQLTDPSGQLKNMWMAYWDFAFAEKEIYQLMFGIGTNCCSLISGDLSPQFLSTIKLVLKIKMQAEVDDNFVLTKFYGYWATVHGLIAINFLKKTSCSKLNQNVLTYAFNEVMVS